MPIHRLIIALILIAMGSIVFASDDEDKAPEPDLGLGAESVPEESKLQLRDLTFTPIAGQPLIDGDITDPFWEQAESFDLDIELYPTRLAPAIVETKAWVGISETHIYVAFNAFDPNPRNIRSAFRERDGSKDDDYVSIIIDTTGTLAKKYEFRVNPHGTLSDVVQDTISERYIYDWDARWEGAASINDKGYTVEIAIPVGSIRAPVLFDKEDHKGIVILKRSYPRRVDRTLATFFSFNRQLRESPEAPGDADSVEFSLANNALDKLTLRPHYIYHFDEKRPIGGEFEQVGEHNVHEAGLDAKYDFNTASTLSVTINPNYTEVEADIARQAINNPFNVFQPEKRRFFRASTEYYNTLVPAVYTRNIIRPQWGISYIRDEVNSSAGAFWVNDRETEVIMPDSFGSEKVELLEASNSSAFRYRYSKDQRSIGVIGTRREAHDYHNRVIGVDGLLDLGIDDKMRYQVLFSDTQYPERFADDLCVEDDCTLAPPPVFCPLGDCAVNAQVLRTSFGQPLQGYGMQLRYKHDGVKSLYWMGYEEYSPEFRADLGFVRRVDIRSLNLAYGRKWYVNALLNDEGKSRIRSYLIYTHTRSHEDNELLENGLGLWAEFRGSYQSVLRLGRRFRERAVNRINQASLEHGSNSPLFDESYWQWYFETSPWPNWTFNLDGRIGKTADADNLVLGEMKELKPRVSFRRGHLQLMGSVTMRKFRTDDEDLYEEKFLSLTALYRRDHQVSHRLIYLDDLTTRDTQRWLGSEMEREVERTLEYTFVYKLQRKWSMLAGFKAESDFKSDVNDEDITNREVYLKIEKRL
jgi:hypothetical protein